jgi:5-methylcytosine-specific restriction endonuclease McrA
MKVLALSPSYEPLGVISWTKAITLIFSNKVTTLEEYDHHINSPSMSMRAPAVVLFKSSKASKYIKNSIRFSRKNVWLRDEGECQYCDRQISYAAFTLDHVIPKTAGGKTSWDNVVTSCYSCNQRKANKSLKEVGFSLKTVPKKPSRLPHIHEITSGRFGIDFSVPSVWKFYLER